jgi:hypothetical protein
VDCGKLARTLPEFRPQWTVRAGMEQLYEAFRRHRLTREQFLGDSFLRIKHLLKLQAEGQLDASLRWAATPQPVPARIPV